MINKSSTSTTLTSFSYCFPWSFTNRTNGFCSKSLSIEVLFLSQSKTFTCACWTRLQIFRTFSSSSLTYWTSRLSREFSFDYGSIVNITNWNRQSKFKWRRLSLISWIFRISFVNASHLFNRSKHIFAISFIFLSFFIVAESIIGCINTNKPYLSNFIFLVLSYSLSSAYIFWSFC